MDNSSSPTSSLSNQSLSLDITELRKNTQVYTAYYCEENCLQLYKYLETLTTITSSTSTNTSSPKFDLSSALVIFITNPNKTCPVWYQRASNSPNKPVIWDYHVVLAIKHQPSESSSNSTSTSSSTFPSTFSSFLSLINSYYIYDLDTTLTFPLSIYEYFIYITTGIHPSALDGVYTQIVQKNSNNNISWLHILQLVITKIIQYHHKTISNTLYWPYFRIISIPDLLLYFSSDRRHMFNSTTGTYNATPPIWECYYGKKAKEYNISYTLDTILDMTSYFTSSLNKNKLPNIPNKLIYNNSSESKMNNTNTNTITNNEKSNSLTDELITLGTIVDLEGLLNYFLQYIKQ